MQLYITKLIVEQNYFDVVGKHSLSVNMERWHSTVVAFALHGGLGNAMNFKGDVIGMAISL